MPRIDPAPIDPGLQSHPVLGLGLRAGPLGAQFGPEPTLLVFLRHFG